MSKPIKAIDTSSLESLDKAYETSREYHDRERLMAIRLASHGRNTLEQIGSILKRGRATIAMWLKSYREGGIENLLYRDHIRAFLLPSRYTLTSYSSCFY